MAKKPRDHFVNAQIDSLNSEQAFQVQRGIENLVHRAAPEAHGRIERFKRGNVLDGVKKFFNPKELGSGD